MPTVRRSAKKSAATPPPPDVDDSARALEPVATHLESVQTNPGDGSVASLGVVNDATETKEPKAAKDAKSDAQRQQQQQQTRSSKLPAGLQFPLVAVISFSLSSMLFSLLNVQTGGELAGVGKSLDSWEEIGVLAGWRITELALGWFGNFDGFDLAALNLLAHGPTVYLLATFYNISAPTAIAAVVIEMLATFVPFQLLRPLSAPHTRGARGVTGAADRAVVTDIPIAIYTTALSAIVYGVTVFTALHTYLPTSLVLYFEGIPSLEPAYGAGYATILPVTLAFGLAARTFVFTPFAATGRSAEDGRLGEFDPVTATFGETLSFNLFGYTTRAKVVMFRTAVAVAVTGLNTFLQAWLTVGGVKPEGAAAYAGAWAAAAFLAGSLLAFVGGDA